MRHLTVFFRVLILAAGGVVTPAGAQFVQLPPAPRDAATAQADFDKRAAAITRFNACGREIAYAKYRKELEREELGSQKENFPTIVIAKLAWLTDPRYANVPCEYETFIPRTDPAVSVEHFANAHLGWWADPSTPTRCSFPTSAAASNRGRRVVPFRRLADANTFHLYEFFSTADHEAVRAGMLYGQTQLIPHGINPDGATMMIFDAVSSYRAPQPVVEVAVERKAPFQQTVKHWAVEGYFSSPSFTMSLGGVQLPAAIALYGKERSKDRGVAVPIVLIPTTGGLNMAEVFGFAGAGTEHQRMNNLCGWKGFVCGIEPILPKAFPCDPLTIGNEYVFLSSARCADKREPHFYLALRKFPCKPEICGVFFAPGLSDGFMEMVEAPSVRDDAHFSNWVARRIPAMRPAAPDDNGVGTYRLFAGDVIRYQIRSETATILEVNGLPRRDFATRGAVLDSDGAGRAVIRSPWSGSRVEIDFTDWQLPRRRTLP